MSNIAVPSPINIRNKTLDLSSPKIMGILNATPDSFSDGGEFNQVDDAVEHIGEMLKQGASIIDVGGESTRPGSEPVAESEELDRVKPILEQAIPKFSDTFFSIDTTKYQVAKEALKLGAHFVNDVSGLQKEPRLADLCVEYGAGFIMMHSQGDPKTMQDDPSYSDVVKEVYQFFEEQINKAEEKGLQNIIIDPGIGFGKTMHHNLKLLANLNTFRQLGYPVMVGASRKSMIGKILDGRPTDGRITGTVAVHYDAMMRGANIIRVHDVQEAHDSLQVFNAISAVK
ncbi:Dihydropteroate synthase [Fodinibius salinus]|uniref:Dihydropteroate synthase n=1 Tax=Fodinibius salinus TaxID=860790 RepID=A0A5D3YP88_9BACT|nr:dihydropteroate synthase [Fodinibius salinus]TYP93979.1 Dihydropteroate synthase [Fodinibius salinus]